MTERTQKILTWIRQQNLPMLALRQASLAELFGCSRRSIGRSLNELKQANLLVDLNQRHENRCKLYRLEKEEKAHLRQGFGGQAGLTRQAQIQWDRFHKTFLINFARLDGQEGRPHLEKLYAKVTWELEHVTAEIEFWNRTFMGIWSLPECEAIYGTFWKEIYLGKDLTKNL